MHDSQTASRVDAQLEELRAAWPQIQRAASKIWRAAKVTGEEGASEALAAAEDEMWDLFCSMSDACAFFGPTLTAGAVGAAARAEMRNDSPSDWIDFTTQGAAAGAILGASGTPLAMSSFWAQATGLDPLADPTPAGRAALASTCSAAWAAWMASGADAPDAGEQGARGAPRVPTEALVEEFERNRLSLSTLSFFPTYAKKKLSGLCGGALAKEPARTDDDAIAHRIQRGMRNEIINVFSGVPTSYYHRTGMDASPHEPYSPDATMKAALAWLDRAKLLAGDDGAEVLGEQALALGARLGELDGPLGAAASSLPKLAAALSTVAGDSQFLAACYERGTPEASEILAIHWLHGLGKDAHESLRAELHSIAYLPKRPDEPDTADVPATPAEKARPSGAGAKLLSFFGASRSEPGAASAQPKQRPSIASELARLEGIEEKSQNGGRPFKAQVPEFRKIALFDAFIIAPGFAADWARAQPGDKAAALARAKTILGSSPRVPELASSWEAAELREAVTEDAPPSAEPMRSRRRPGL